MPESDEWHESVELQSAIQGAIFVCSCTRAPPPTKVESSVCVCMMINLDQVLNEWN